MIMTAGANTMKLDIVRLNLLVSILTVAAAVAPTFGAELAVDNVVMAPGTVAQLVVSGQVAGQDTYGLTVLLELVPRAGAAGTVRFADDAGIVQLGDPWPASGTFSMFDNGMTGSPARNGMVDDNGTFLTGDVSYSGPLAGFALTASPDARGVWDVLLSTPTGNSGWQGLSTTLIAGSVSICLENGVCDDGENCSACPADCGCDDGVACTVDACNAGSCSHTPNNALCPSDGLFCNGQEVCHATQGCTSTGNPCTSGICFEATDTCKQRIRPGPVEAQ